MKNKRLLGLGLALVVLAGCATQSLYTTLASVESATTQAYTAYLHLVITGQIPTNSVPSVSRDYNVFQAVMGATVTLSANGTLSPATTNVTAAAAQVVSDIAAAKAVAGK